MPRRTGEKTELINQCFKESKNLLTKTVLQKMTIPELKAYKQKLSQRGPKSTKRRSNSTTRRSNSTTRGKTSSKKKSGCKFVDNKCQKGSTQRDDDWRCTPYTNRQGDADCRKKPGYDAKTITCKICNGPIKSKKSFENHQECNKM